MAKRKRTNRLIIVAFFLLVAAIFGYAGIYSYAPKDGDAAFWSGLQKACLVLALFAVCLWMAGFIKRRNDNRTDE